MEKQFIIKQEEEDLEVTLLKSGEILIHVCPHLSSTAATSLLPEDARRLGEWLIKQSSYRY